jgi:hypothetical protein
MSRLPLIHIPNGIYSVVSKCNNNEFHFDAVEKFLYYLDHLLECKQKLGFKLYDVCCMSNRKLPRQGDSSKVEFPAVILLRNTLGGIRPSAS